MNEYLSHSMLTYSSYLGYSRGDSMVWDFMGRRPLPVKDFFLDGLG